MYVCTYAFCVHRLYFPLGLVVNSYDTQLLVLLMIRLSQTPSCVRVPMSPFVLRCFPPSLASFSFLLCLLTLKKKCKLK